MNPKIRALNTVPYVSVENMMNLVRDIGVERFLTKLSLYIALGSNFKCNTHGPQGIGCCDGQTIQAPRQRGTWRDIRRA